MNSLQPKITKNDKCYKEIGYVDYDNNCTVYFKGAYNGTKASASNLNGQYWQQQILHVAPVCIDGYYSLLEFTEMRTRHQ